MSKWFIYLNLAVPFFIKLFIPDGRYGSITIFTDTIVLPVTLTILNIVLLLNKIEASFSKCFSFMLLGLLLGNFVGYIIWGISSKNLFRPDAETLWITRALVIYYTCFVIVLFIIFQIGRILVQFFRPK